MSSETGIIECPIRLPCTHLVGSYCIAVWLRDNNTCPVCRCEFFPTQPRQNLEHGDVQGDGDDYDSDDDYNDDLERLMETIERASFHLELSGVTARLSKTVARRSFHMQALGDCSRCAKAAISIFVASHLLSDPVTLERIAPVLEVTPRTIYNTYRLFFPERETVIDREYFPVLLENLGAATTESPLALAWPQPEYTVTFWYMITSRIDLEEDCTILIEVSRRLFSILANKTYFNTNHVTDVVALSIYLASYLRSIPLRCQEIASATGVSENDIRSNYAVFYPHRKDLLEHPEADTTWMENDLERRLDGMPQEMPLDTE